MRPFILTGYIKKALTCAEYDKLEDGTFAGRIPPCPGVIAFSRTLRGCEKELRSTLEDWVLLGLKLGHPLPIIGEYDLNKKVAHEPMAAM
ncbi:hypothetical protein U14_05841 [Candidatus Moduliflexus flocculans]|uniref:Type II toxin-antitoxin system HicB family antitoxin n=1 Tax=Candidatus Moduliflexus flocculans TaxID=1499966 RepID=A0A081BT23_9BACT|nr:hypothetical protein U14_05841 [Candidatus Moduliflexus flocculans]